MAILVSKFSERLMLLLLLIGLSDAQLRPDFYSATCPGAAAGIRSIVNRVILREPQMGATLLLLHFADCFVYGCDASNLLDDTATFNGEKGSFPSNSSLRAFDVIDDIKNQVEAACPRVVSCADILAVAAGASVAAMGGPRWNVPLGRRDFTITSLRGPNREIPSARTNLTSLISAFANRGLTTRDMVALSGAHTIGQARCINFRERIYNDTNINPIFAATLRARCPRSWGDDDDTLSRLDAISPWAFNNDYYVNLMGQNGLLHSDQELFNGGSTDRLVRTYATNSVLFFRDFETAMIKMSRINPLTGRNGIIRRNCRRDN